MLELIHITTLKDIAISTVFEVIIQPIAPFPLIGRDQTLKIIIQMVTHVRGVPHYIPTSHQGSLSLYQRGKITATRTVNAMASQIHVELTVSEIFRLVEVAKCNIS